MGSAYTIFGKQVQPHVLAVLTLGTAAGLGVFTGSGSKKSQAPTPTSGSGNDDVNVDQLINDFIKQESEDKK